MGADVTPFFTQDQGDIPDMTQTHARVIRPKGSAAFSRHLSGHLGALIILARQMGHEIFQRFLLDGFPRASDRKDKTPPACGISLVTVLDHTHIGLGTIGGIAAHNHQLRPTWWDKLVHHLAEHGIFTKIAQAAPLLAAGGNERVWQGAQCRLPYRV